MDNLKKLLQLLGNAQIEFVIIGGVAANLHGSSQVTQDIDIVTRLSAHTITKLRACLAPYHPVHRMTPQKLSFLEVPEKLDSVKNLYLATDLGVLDVLGELPGVGTFNELAARADETRLDDQIVKILSLDDLIASKTQLGRNKDKATVLELRVIKSKQT
jgi:predicted nucleotidyltransferase